MMGRRAEAAVSGGNVCVWGWGGLYVCVCVCECVSKGVACVRARV